MKISAPWGPLFFSGFAEWQPMYHANVLNYEDAEVNRFFCEALFKIGYEESVDTLLPTVLKVGEINLKCMALLDKANTKTYGTRNQLQLRLP